MKLKKTFAAVAAGALSVAMGAAVFAGCAKGTDYTFEAEDAVAAGTGNVNGQGQGDPTVSNESAYKLNGELVEDATLVGIENFNTVGQTITWTVVSSADCKATLTLHAASAAMYMGEDGMGLKEIDFGTTEAYKVTCNDTAASLTGKLPGAAWADWSGMQEPGTWWNMGAVSGTVNLKKGENVIVLEVVGAVDGAMSAGLNVDKIVINASAELSAKS